MDEAGRLRDRAERWRKMARLFFSEPRSATVLNNIADDLDQKADDLDGDFVTLQKTAGLIH
jgi:hypothetical protein